MTIPLLLALALLASLCMRLKWRRLGAALGIAAGAAFLAIGCGPAAWALLASLQDGYDTEAHSWGDHNAIILLGAGSELSDRHAAETGFFGYGRLVKALQVYRACKAHSGDCRIIASGGDTHGFGTSEAELFRAQLTSLGVPSDDVVAETRSQNTWQNAQFSARIVADRRFDQTFLVTSGVHLRRALMYFAHFGIRATAMRSDYARPAVALVPTAYNFFLTDIALHERIGIWRYHVYNALGWNSSPTKAGSP
jgi:uncharacterized SAM-binding protein YcdF (DUF218 family)